MKKTLLFSLLLSSAFSFAQVLQSENFNALTIGNVGTDITGTTAGQGSWLTLSGNGTAPTTSTNANNSNFQIVASGNSGTNGFRLQGPNGDKGSSFMWKDGLPTAWAARTAGNNIIEVEVDINPGTRGASRNVFGIYIYNSDYTRTLSGFQVNSATGELSLVAYSTPSGNPVGNYSYSLAAAPGVLLPENTWSRVGISYNRATGRANINTSVITGGSLGVNGSSPSTDPVEVDLFAFSGHTPSVPNTSSTTMIFDNFVVRASNTDTLLNTTLVESTVSTVSVYPNPANDIINVSIINSNGTVAVKKASITDINGRIIKNLTSVANNQINVSDLNSGIYFLNIETNEGSTVKKFIKN